MEKTHRAVLLSHRLTLAKELDIKEVCQFLVENGILSDRMVEEILSKPTDFDRNVAFLNKLPTRGPRAFEAFYNSLLETDQSFLAALLKPNNAPIGRSDCTDVGFAPSSFSMSTSPLAKSTPTKRSHSDMNSSFSPSSFEMSGVSGIQSKSCTIRSMGRSVLTEQNGNEELRQNKHCENSIGSRIPVENMDASNSEGDSPQSAAETSSSSMTYHLNSLRSNRSLESLHSIAGILPSTSTNHYTTAKFTTNRISNTNHINDVTAGNEDEDSVAMLVCDSPTTNHVTVKMASPEFLMEHAMDCYPMFGTCKGLALIINVENFEPSACLDDRAGADKDYARMELTLKQLSFEVYHLKNGTAVEIWNTLKNFAAWSKLAEADSCFIVLMSHGEDGAIYGRDGKTIPLPNIFDLFSNINCPHLQNKPKGTTSMSDFTTRGFLPLSGPSPAAARYY